MNRPTNSMWGQVDYYREVIPDVVFDVSTPSHGGLMIEEEWAKANLSAAALEQTRFNAVPFCGWICYEEDCSWDIPVYDSTVIRHAWVALRNEEFPFKPALTETEFLKNLEESLQRWNTHYLEAVKAERKE